MTEAGIESFPASDPPSYSKRDEPPPGAGRKSLQEADLLEWMSGRLRHEPRYRACHFTSVERLDAADPDECNWLTAHLHCDAAPDKECMDAANEIIEEAKSRFNVADARA